MKNAKTIKEINNEKWGSFINNDLEEITNYTYSWKSISQDIDVVEVECITKYLL